MKNKEKETRIGIVIESLPNTTFRVKLGSGEDIFGYLSGRMRMHFIKILVGDKVKVEMSPYDQSKGRIIQRL